MRRLLTCLAVASVLVMGSGVSTASATEAAAKPACASKKEVRRAITKLNTPDGVSKAQVRRIFGTRGKLVFKGEDLEGNRIEIRRYRPCKARANGTWVGVNYSLPSKKAFRIDK